MIELRRLTLARPRRDRADRAQRLPDAVVALDVRGRAREAVVDLPRRLRRRDDERLVGYLIISRYVDAWHVMNVAVDADYRRRGIATQLLERLFELTAGDDRRGYTLEVRVSNEAAIELYEGLGLRRARVRRGYYTDNREDALIMWKDPVARDAPARVILGIETSCDETAAALVTEDGRILANVVSSQAELHARYGGVVPEVASRRHLELVAPGRSTRRSSEAGAELDDVERVAVTHGPGPDRRPARRPLGREGARLGAAAAARPGRPPARPRRLALPLASR